MRAKISFRNRRKIRLDRHPSQFAEWEGEYAKVSDDDLPATLKNFVRHWRWMYAQCNLIPQGIRATLDGLTELSDDEIRQAARVIDEDTECELDRATVIRWESNTKDECPSIHEFCHEFRTSKDLRELAAIAHATFPKRRGRSRIQEIDRIVAPSLAA
ncbi:MAG: hypothetical protein WAT12_04750 [Candidatus Nitrotoga sp.]